METTINKLAIECSSIFKVINEAYAQNKNDFVYNDEHFSIVFNLVAMLTITDINKAPLFSQNYINFGNFVFDVMGNIDTNGDHLGRYGYARKENQRLQNIEKYMNLSSVLDNPNIGITAYGSGVVDFTGTFHFSLLLTGEKSSVGGTWGMHNTRMIDGLMIGGMCDVYVRSRSAQVVCNHGITDCAMIAVHELGHAFSMTHGPHSPQHAMSVSVSQGNHLILPFLFEQIKELNFHFSDHRGDCLRETIEIKTVESVKALLQSVRNGTIIQTKEKNIQIKNETIDEKNIELGVLLTFDVFITTDSTHTDHLKYIREEISIFTEHSIDNITVTFKHTDVSLTSSSAVVGLFFSTTPSNTQSTEAAAETTTTTSNTQSTEAAAETTTTTSHMQSTEPAVATPPPRQTPEQTLISKLGPGIIALITIVSVLFLISVISYMLWYTRNTGSNNGQARADNGVGKNAGVCIGCGNVSGEWHATGAHYVYGQIQS
jgi:hypothetical protein